MKETHRKCVIGGIAAGSIDFEVRLPQDENGKVDIFGNGKYNEEEKSVLNVKYEKEVRLSLAVCAIVAPNGSDKLLENMQIPLITLALS